MSNAQDHLRMMEACHKSVHNLQLFSFVILYPSHIYKLGLNTNL